MFVYNSQYDYFESSLLKELGVTSGFGTKETPPIPDFVQSSEHYTMLQVHGTAIHDITQSSDTPNNRIENVDGLYTMRDDTLLLVKSADCIPVLYYDPTIGALATSHQGWKGTYKNMAGTMIQHMIDAGSKAENIYVAIGASIGDCCYGLTGERVEMFNKEYAQWFAEFSRVDGTLTYINLRKLNYLQLVDTGVLHNHIDTQLRCTHCDTNTYYSYRRGDKVAEDPSIRMWSFIMK